MVYQYANTLGSFVRPSAAPVVYTLIFANTRRCTWRTQKNPITSRTPTATPTDGIQFTRTRNWMPTCRCSGPRVVRTSWVKRQPAIALMPHMARSIRNHNPDAKLVAVLRDPVERAWSMYLYWHQFNPQYQRLRSDDFRLRFSANNMMTDQERGHALSIQSGCVEQASTGPT